MLPWNARVTNNEWLIDPKGGRKINTIIRKRQIIFLEQLKLSATECINILCCDLTRFSLHFNISDMSLTERIE